MSMRSILARITLPTLLPELGINGSTDLMVVLISSGRIYAHVVSVETSLARPFLDTRLQGLAFNVQGLVGKCSGEDMFPVMPSLNKKCSRKDMFPVVPSLDIFAAKCW